MVLLAGLQLAEIVVGETKGAEIFSVATIGVVLVNIYPGFSSRVSFF